MTAALVGAVVPMVRVASPAEVPLIVTVLVEPKLDVGASCAPAGWLLSRLVSA
jgi:hypothetical protein